MSNTTIRLFASSALKITVSAGGLLCLLYSGFDRVAPAAVVIVISVLTAYAHPVFFFYKFAFDFTREIPRNEGVEEAYFQLRQRAFFASLDVLVGAFLWMLVGFANVYEALGLVDAASRSEVHDASVSLYFSAITATTLGYGDFIPTHADRIFSALEAVSGLVLFAMSFAIFGRLAYLAFSPDSGRR